MKRRSIFLSGIIFFSLMANIHALSLEQVSKGFSAKPVRKGKFETAKTLKASGRTLKSNGKFLFAENEIILKNESPVKSILIMSEDKLVQKTAQKKVEMNGADNPTYKGIATALSSVFWADAAEMSKSFALVFTENSQGGNAGNASSGNASSGSWKIELEPLDSTIKAVISKIILSGTVDSDANSILESMELIDQAENSTKYTFKDQTLMDKISAEEKSEIADAL